MNTIMLPRGIRNNNPGNIRLSSTIWQGQKPPPQLDPSFIEFVSPLFGLRALMRLLLTYHLKYGLDTVSSIINRYAPPHENATDHYAAAVARALRVKRTDTVNLLDKERLIAMATAIVRHENGQPPVGTPSGWYAPVLYAQAAGLVLPVSA